MPIKRKPVPIYYSIHSQPSTVSTTATKYSAEFPVPASLKCDYYALIAGSEHDFSNVKPWQAALNMNMKNADVLVDCGESDSDSMTEIETAIPRWRDSYSSSWIEMDADSDTDTDSESLELEESDVEAACNDRPRSAAKIRNVKITSSDANKNTIGIRSVGRARSQTFPHRAQEAFGIPPPTSMAVKERNEYLHLAEPSPPFGIQASRRKEEAEEAKQAQIGNVTLCVQSEPKSRRRSDVKLELDSPLKLSSCGSKVKTMPLSRSPSLSFETFWEQGGAETKSKGKNRAYPPLSFSVDDLPTAADVRHALYLKVLTEDGTPILFRTILRSDSNESTHNIRTIVCFIRHFLCPLCQDFLMSIARDVDPNVLKKAGLRLVIVGNGGWEMIKSYRRIFNLPYPIYTDPTAALYTTLGMTLRTLDPGPKPRASTSGSTIPETYVRHRSILSGVSFVLRNAVKARMPIWKYMGDKEVLGGEFVFQLDKSSGLGSRSGKFECIFAHRMRYTTAHEEIGKVMEEAGMGSGSATRSEKSKLNASNGARMARGDPCPGGGTGIVDCKRGRSLSLVTISTSLSRISCSSTESIELKQLTTQPRQPPLASYADLDPSSSTIQDPVMARITSSFRRSASPSISCSSSTESLLSSTTSSTESSSWRAMRNRELWLMKEKKRWRRISGFIGEVQEDILETSKTSASLDGYTKDVFPAEAPETQINFPPVNLEPKFAPMGLRGGVVANFDVDLSLPVKGRYRYRVG